VADEVLYVKDASASTIYKWDTGTYRDDTTTDITPAVETPWIRPSQPGAFGRLWEVRLLGYSPSIHKLTVKIAYDDTPRWIDTLTFDSEALSAFDFSEHLGDMDVTTQDHAYLLRFRGSRTKCTSVRFRFEATVPDFSLFCGLRDGNSGKAYVGEYDGTTFTTHTLDATSGGPIMGLWGTSNTNVWAVGDGQAWYYNGTWTEIDAISDLTSEQLNGVHGASETEIFAVGENRTALKYDGTFWSAIDTATWPNEHLVVVRHIPNSDHIWIGTSAGKVMRSTDRGGTWAQVTTGITNSIHGIYATATDSIWLSTRNHYLGASANAGKVYFYDGSTFAEVASVSGGQEFDDVNGTRADDVWAAVSGVSQDDMWHYDGTSWAKQDMGVNSFWNFTVFGPSNVVYVLGSTWLTSDQMAKYDRSSWSEVTPGWSKDHISDGWAPSAGSNAGLSLVALSLSHGPMRGLKPLGSTRTQD
jgi:hypothetical protein